MFIRTLGAALGLALSVSAVAQQDPAAAAGPLVITASNTRTNALMVYSPTGTLLRVIPTQGQGGVSGNAGGIAARFDRLAVVNYGSGNVSVFAIDEGWPYLHLTQVVRAAASPVSVAFGHDHLYILSTSRVESHEIGPRGIAASADGEATLVIGDGSAAQVGVTRQELVISEKSNAIETVRLRADGAIAGATRLVAGIPQNVNAPFGLATRGDEAYVTIAHANEISLVRDDAVVTVTGSGTQMAPCWVTLDGPYLFSANSPSQSVSRYVVYGPNIIQEAAVVAQFQGNPTDIAYADGLAAVVDSNGSVSHVSVFRVDDDGNFTSSGTATINSPAVNGMAVIRPVPAWDHP